MLSQRSIEHGGSIGKRAVIVESAHATSPLRALLRHVRPPYRWMRTRYLRWRHPEEAYSVGNETRVYCVFVDVGAHFGFFAKTMAEFAGSVARKGHSD